MSLNTHRPGLGVGSLFQNYTVYTYAYEFIGLIFLTSMKITIYNVQEGFHLNCYRTGKC